jgi:hypothetical protein
VPGPSLGSNCKRKRAAVYVRRRPERSAAYQVVRENLETWLAERRAGRLVAGANWVIDPVPGYVERDLRKILECGILAHGFAQAWCGCWQSALNIQGCRCWPVQIGPFPPVALSVPLGISNKCDRLPLSNGAVQVSAQWCLTGAGPALTICRWLWV